MKQKIVVLSHCFLNDGVKLTHQNIEEQAAEKKAKIEFVKKLLDYQVEILQLPCPEFLIYGSKRWGHASSQFNNPFFRRAAREMLEPIVLQLEEYSASPERFEILGVLGIEGSPSCGVTFTYDGDWSGELSGHPELKDTLSGIARVDHAGVFIEVIKEMLQEKGMDIPIHSLETFPM